jgi:hypothetical protein
MASPEQIELFLRRYIGARQDVALEGFPGWHPVVAWYGPRPTIDELASDLLTQAEFRSLQLADLLNSPDGAIIDAGVRLAIPSIYAADVALFVAAMRLAARSQRMIGVKRAGLVAFALVVVFVLGLTD